MKEDTPNILQPIDTNHTSLSGLIAENEIIIYQPDSTVKLEVRLENDTVWLTQQQIADLFGTKRPAITKHLANIYKSGELDKDSTCSILEHMGNDGNSVVPWQKLIDCNGTWRMGYWRISDCGMDQLGFGVYV